ncbi:MULTISPECIES: GNAT family N-acetyltransferase [unclassified Azospirillum]|uniref:GNAT family N-acetyltransferase n=1 Tax=unclassified Azospirillum TaxID=2630922 RepID=UPI0013592D06|nr:MULTISPECIES: GNAT family N-acetyltransferase [unclassified Azospirillum]
MRIEIIQDKNKLSPLQETLDNEVSAAFPNYDGIVDIFYTRNPTYFGAFEDNHLIGVATISGTIDNTCELYKLYISPTHRNRGYGESLLRHVLDEIKRSEVNRVCVEISGSSLSFWKKIVTIFQLDVDVIPPKNFIIKLS